MSAYSVCPKLWDEIINDIFHVLKGTSVTFATCPVPSLSLTVLPTSCVIERLFIQEQSTVFLCCTIDEQRYTFLVGKLLLDATLSRKVANDILDVGLSHRSSTLSFVKVGYSLSEGDINLIVTDLAIRLVHDYINKDRHPVFLIVANGALHFGSDLLLAVQKLAPISKMRLDTVKIGSYTDNEQGSIRLLSELEANTFTGQDVILVDDICDTGRTLDFLRAQLLTFEPASVEYCVLLDRDRSSDHIVPKYVGLHVPSSAFLVGYGMDDRGMYRSRKTIQAVSTTC